MNMEDKIKAVKEKLSCIDTEELLGIISLHFTTFANANGEIQENLPFQFTSELMFANVYTIQGQWEGK